MSSQEVEKFLEGLTRYLHRQRLAEQVHQQVSSEENYDPEDGAANRKTSGEERFAGQETGSNFITLPRPSGGKWSLANSEQRDGLNVKQRPTYGKRNSELINSLLGLPRFMKVVGWKRTTTLLFLSRKIIRRIVSWFIINQTIEYGIDSIVSIINQPQKIPFLLNKSYE